MAIKLILYYGEHAFRCLNLGDVITLVHGAGGEETEKIIRKLFVSAFKFKRVKDGIGLDDLDDGSTIPVKGGNYVFTMDSFTVNPLFFPGGNIGKLAAVGTINDLAVMGAKPIAVLDSIIVAEGFEYGKLEKIVEAFKNVLESHNVALLGGDFKVMPKNSLDEIIISVAGIGFAERVLRDSDVKPGDKIIVTGPIAEHGAVILAEQMGIPHEESGLKSDCAPVLEPIRELLKLGGLHAAKDPTRGGIANALNEFAEKSNVTIKVYEENVPIRGAVRGLCEMLGVDPFSLASEGIAVLSVDGDYADEAVKRLRNMGYKYASIIGEAQRKGDFPVILETVIGGERPLRKPSGLNLPRIC